MGHSHQERIGEAKQFDDEWNHSESLPLWRHVKIFSLLATLSALSTNAAKQENYLT